MLTRVEVVNALQRRLKLPMDLSDMFDVKDIEGIGPVKAEIATTSYSGVDGGVVSNVRSGSRNIVIQLGLNPRYIAGEMLTATQLRRLLYDYFTTQMQVEMFFYSDDYETIKIKGVVESMEPSIFSAEPTVTISIICPDPHFQSLTPTTEINVGTGLIDAPYAGTVPTGFVLTVSDIVTPAINGGFRFSRWANELVSMGYAGNLYNFGVPHTLQISTVKGNKYARLAPTKDFDTEVKYGLGTLPFEGQNVMGFIEGQWLDIRQNDTLFGLRLFHSPQRPPKVFLRYTTRHAGL